MADRFGEDPMDSFGSGRLVIATTDEEHMDCSTSSGTGIDSLTSAAAESSTKNVPALARSSSENRSLDPNKRLSPPVDSSTGRHAASMLPDSTQSGTAGHVEAAIKLEEDTGQMEDGELLEDEGGEEATDRKALNALGGKKKKQKGEKMKQQQLIGEVKLEDGQKEKQQHCLELESSSNNGEAGNGKGHGKGQQKKMKKKKVMLDKATMISAKPNGQSSLDEHLLTMRPGTQLTIDVTIICKASGGNTLYICAKWKGRDYHGVLTDGEPLYTHLCSQKRAAAHLAAEKAAAGQGPNGQQQERTGSAGGGKQRGGKRGGGPAKNAAGGEKRAKASGTDSNGPGIGMPTELEAQKQSLKPAEAAGAAPGTEHGGEQYNKSTAATAASSSHFLQPQHGPGLAGQRRRLSSSSMSSSSAHHGNLQQKHGLNDVEGSSNRRHPIRCPHPQCGFRFENTVDVNTHLLIGHGTAERKAAIFEDSATQTSPAPLATISCGTSEEDFPLICTKCRQPIGGGAEPTGGEQTKGEAGPGMPKRRPGALGGAGTGAPSNATKKMPEKGGKAAVTTAGTAKEGEEDISPGFSDISDEAAPTLEKQQPEEMGGAANTSVAGTLDQTVAYRQGEDGTSIGTPCKSAPQLADCRLPQPKCPSPKVEGKKSMPTIKTEEREAVPMPTVLLPAADVSTFGQHVGAVTGGMTPAMAAAMMLGGAGGQGQQQMQLQQMQHNPFMPAFPPQLQALVAAHHHQQQQQQQQYATAQQQLAMAAASTSAMSAAPKFMGPPPPGLLSLGTPLVSAASSTSSSSTSTAGLLANGPSGMKNEQNSSQVHQHKIYELQQMAASAAGTSSSSSAGKMAHHHTATTLARASSTRPTNTNNNGATVSPTPSRRPMSALPPQQQQQQQMNQQHQQKAPTTGMPPPPPQFASLLAHHQQPQHQQQFMFRPSLSPLGTSGPAASFFGTGNFVPPLQLPVGIAQSSAGSPFFAVQQQQMGGKRSAGGTPMLMNPSSSSSTPTQAMLLQQQQQQQQQMAAMLNPGFQAQANFLAAAAVSAASGMDLNMLQQLIGAATAAAGSSTAAQAQQQQSQQK